MIGFRTAMILFAALAAFAVITLHGVALAFALVIVVGLAAKTWIHHIRRRME